MIGLKFTEKGMMLLSVLILTVILLMLTVSMITMVSENTNMTGKIDKKIKALKAAEAGVEYAFYQLSGDCEWGDPAVDTTFLSDIQESIGNDQKFTLIFDQTKPYYTKNNLKNDTVMAGTPPYCAEIICEGIYERDGVRESSILVKAIFVRDDMSPFPIFSEGETHLDAWCNTSMSPIYYISGTVFTDPGRLHSNDRITIWGNDGQVMDLNDGFMSCCNTVSLTRVGNTFKKKENIPSVVTPDIDIQKIIDDRPVCKNLKNNTFYLIGYFEYDPNNYCIPYSGPNASPFEPWVHGGPELGVIAFTPLSPPPGKDKAEYFLDKYGDFYYNPYPWQPGGDTRNFYDYYSSIDFWAYSDPGFTGNIKSELGANIVKTNDPNTGDAIITVTLEKDLYISSTNGIFDTSEIGWNGYSPPPRDVYFPELMKGARVVIDFDDHIIYGKKLYLGVPVVANDPNQTAGIVSTETIDFIHSFDQNMVALSDKTIRMAYRQAKDGAVSTFKGILYAEDDILIQTIGVSGDQTDVLNINGCLLSKDVTQNNCTTSPLVNYPYIIGGVDNNLYISPMWVSKVNILHTYDGLNKLADIRETFKVRKKYCEVIK